jgi:sugar phosphate isomerase/epimerase
MSAPVQAGDQRSTVWGAVVNGIVLGHEPEGRLGALAAAGYREVETGLPRLPHLAPLLRDAGLTPRSAFLPTELVTGHRDLWKQDNLAGGVSPLPDTYTLNTALEDASRIDGLTTLVVAALLPDERRTLDDYRRFADQMNATCERCAPLGLTLAFHAHSFDFEPIEGVPPMNVLRNRFDRRVRWEVDVFWVAMAGREPAGFLREHAGRVIALHLKDRSRSAPRPFTGWNRLLPRDAYVPLGAGDLDLPSILAAAADTGVRYRFVEDESTATRFEHLLAGMVYLRTLRR